MRLLRRCALRNDMFSNPVPVIGDALHLFILNTAEGGYATTNIFCYGRCGPIFLSCRFVLVRRSLSGLGWLGGGLGRGRRCRGGGG